jgi:hypothetical protein
VPGLVAPPGVPGGSAPASVLAEASPATARPDARGAITSGSVGRWRRDLSAEDLATVQRVAGDRLTALGYPEA